MSPKKDKPESKDQALSVTNEVIIPRRIEEEVEQSYLDYAMSVIIARALPDVRDGLKPVHRRILYAMWNMGLTADAKFRKSATVIGEVLGKYHPHGDMAVYDSLVRMAQEFSLRYPLIWGQGNFGSMDGDSAAAYRYTEAKLAKVAHTMLEDIDKNTVNFVDNYDGTTKEPRVLPALLPQLLLNGTMGIAVGMATSIPPHNTKEIIDGIIHLIDHPDATVADLMKFIQGPDFPTAGIIYNPKDIEQAYETGKGAIVMRARTDIQDDGGSPRIIVTELPYQVNKATLMEKIAELVKDKKIEGIKDLRDESDKEGVRMVIELKKDAYSKKILNALFHHTQLQMSFHVNMLALVDGVQPRVLNLKMILEEYIKHRKEVIVRRTQFDLDKAKDRAHILEGLVMALEDIDKIIATIKKSKDRDDAKVNLIAKFRLSERQAIAILEMRLQQLANLERIRVEEELKEKKKLIKELESILASPKRVLGIITTELTDLKTKFGDDRKTEIKKHGVDQFTQEDLIPNEAIIVTMTRDGYIKRLPPDTFKTQSRGGKGVVGLTTKEEDMVDHFFAATTHANLLFFTTRGRVFQLKAYELPIGSRQAKGQAIVNFLQLASDEKVTAVLSEEDLSKDDKYFIMVTRLGSIKKVERSQFAQVRRSGLIAITLGVQDVLEWIVPSSGHDDIVLATSQGQAIRFKEEAVRPMGRGARGVRAMRLKKNDYIVGADVVVRAEASKLELLVVTENGCGKRTELKSYKIQGRGGSGIKTLQVSNKTGALVTAKIIAGGKAPEGDLIIISTKGQVIRLSLATVARLGRVTQGVRLMRFKQEKDTVASVTLV